MAIEAAEADAGHVMVALSVLSLDAVTTALPDVLATVMLSVVVMLPQ
jgi:hypothetical protein